jgi:hypothetical protein
MVATCDWRAHHKKPSNGRRGWAENNEFRSDQYFGWCYADLVRPQMGRSWRILLYPLCTPTFAVVLLSRTRMTGKETMVRRSILTASIPSMIDAATAERRNSPAARRRGSSLLPVISLTLDP